MPQLCPVVQWSVHWAQSQMTWVLVLAGARCCALEMCGGGGGMLGPLLGLAKSIYYYLYVLYPCIPLHKWRLLLGLGN